MVIDSFSTRFGAMIFAFFFTSSALTKKGQDTKRLIDPEFKQGGQRNWYVYAIVSFTFQCIYCIHKCRI